MVDMHRRGAEGAKGPVWLIHIIRRGAEGAKAPLPQGHSTVTLIVHGHCLSSPISVTLCCGVHFSSYIVQCYKFPGKVDRTINHLVDMRVPADF